MTDTTPPVGATVTDGTGTKWERRTIGREAYWVTAEPRHQGQRDHITDLWRLQQERDQLQAELREAKEREQRNGLDWAACGVALLTSGVSMPAGVSVPDGIRLVAAEVARLREDLKNAVEAFDEVCAQRDRAQETCRMYETTYGPEGMAEREQLRAENAALRKQLAAYKTEREVMIRHPNRIRREVVSYNANGEAVGWAWVVWNLEPRRSTVSFTDTFESFEKALAHLVAQDTTSADLRAAIDAAKGGA